ncbi:MAG: DUF4426 domain-containing protein [Gammaproteobacteria bacterium]|nr:DUF4426 domain-containing protein [Gammaproteobacteria bacterium]
MTASLIRLFRFIPPFLGGVCLALATPPAQAERVEYFGDYAIHYNAINSTFFSSEVAKNYQVKRSKNLGVLVISVLPKDAGPEPRAFTAMVKGKVRNDLFQSNFLDFREVKEGREARAIYYVASFKHGNNDKLNFAVDIQPEGQNESHSLSFDQTFFAD